MSAGIAALIVHQQWQWALPCLAVAGLTDWLDGLAARWLPGSSPSVLGSYLDPLADKVLICCVVAALGWEVGMCTVPEMQRLSSHHGLDMHGP